MIWRTGLFLLLGVCLCASSTQAVAVDPATLLARVRAKVISDAKQKPRFLCRQMIERRTFAIGAKIPMRRGDC